MKSPLSAAVVGVTWLFLSSCNWSSDHDRTLVLPCGLTQIKWGMSEDQLKQIRPQARWSSSSETYEETLTNCQPFITRASFSFSRWRGLEKVSLWQDLIVETPVDFESLIPGFLYGCRAMFGEPSGIEVFTSPKMTKWKEQYWNVGLWWTQPWGDVYASYSSPKALFPSGDQWQTTMKLTFCPDCIDDFRKWAKSDTTRDSVSKYFGGFPTEAEVRGVALH